MRKKQVMETWEKVFGTDRSVYVIFENDPNDDQYQNPQFQGVFITKKSAEKEVQRIMKMLYWPRRCFEIRKVKVIW